MILLQLTLALLVHLVEEESCFQSRLEEELLNVDDPFRSEGETEVEQLDPRRSQGEDEVAKLEPSLKEEMKELEKLDRWKVMKFRSNSKHLQRSSQSWRLPHFASRVMPLEQKAESPLSLELHK